MYLKFYLENQRMPDVAEMNDICKSLFVAVKAIAPKTEYEEFYRIVEKRETGYETRILKDIQSGITLETFMAKGDRKTPEEKAADPSIRSAAPEKRSAAGFAGQAGGKPVCRYGWGAAGAV